MSGSPLTGSFETVPPTVGSGQKPLIQTDAQGKLLIGGTVAVTITESVGTITWAAPVAVAMTGSSKTFVPADATRKALKLWNPVANAAAAFDDSGGTVVLATSLPLAPGASPVIYTGAETPVGIVTAIGTNTQNIYYQSGS